MVQNEIIVFTDSMGNCGISRVLSELTDVWVRRGYHVSVAYMKKQDECNADYVWQKDIEMIEIPVRQGFFHIYSDLVKAYKKILTQRPDAVAVSLSVMTNYALGACAPFVKNRIIISDRNDPRRRPAGRIKQFIRDLAFKQADVLILQTEDVKKYYQKRIRRTGVVIPNPINGALPEAGEHDRCRRKAIVTASRLNKQKNLGMLIRAFARLASEYPSYVLEIYGRGEEENTMKQLVRDLNLENQVHFMGFSNHLYEDIMDCAMYVCSSDYEGISNSLLEALGLGIPTISTDCPVGGSRLLIENNVNGVLIGVGDEEALYQQMKRLIDNPQFACELSRNAVKVREIYNVQQIAERWIENF